MDNYNDMAIPEIKLVQNVGGEEAKRVGAQPGQFYCALTGEIMEGFDLVVTGRATVERTYWGEGHEPQSDEPPVCSSWDGITSVTGEICQTACPYQAFTDAPGLLKPEERKTKCTPGFKVTGINLSNMMPLFIRCSGISATAARELNTVISFHRNIRGQYFKAKFHVTSIKKRSPSGEAFAIKFSEPVLLEEAVLAEVKEVMQSLTGESVGGGNTIAPFGSLKQVTQGEVYESKPEELARAKANIEAFKNPASVPLPQDEPGTVILGKTEPVKEKVVLSKADVGKVPEAVAKAGAEVKKKLNIDF